MNTQRKGRVVVRHKEKGYGSTNGRNHFEKRRKKGRSKIRKQKNTNRKIRKTGGGNHEGRK